MIGAVLFDVDGTLIDSNDLHVDAWREAFLHFGIDVPLGDISGQIGKGGNNLIPSLLPKEIVEKQQKDIEEYRTELFKRDYLDRARPFPGIAALFKRLHGDGIHIVLASSAGKEELEHHLELTGAKELVSATTSKDDVEHSKPDPDIFAAALEKMAPLTADEVIVVGDSPYDVQAARKLGIRVVGLRSGGFPDEELRNEGAAMIFDGIEDLADHYEEAFALEAQA